MGCWNGTCGLSGLPINVGTEVYIFPIKEGYRDSFCYSTALYRPSVLPFRAEYNDYGAGESCSGPGLDIVIAGVRDQLVEMPVGENKYHDIAVKREGFDEETFFETVHKKRLFFKNPMAAYEGEPKTVGVFFTMIRKDVVDRLWNEWQFDFWKPRGMTEIPAGFESDQYYIKNVTYARLAELIPDYMEHRYNRENPLRTKMMEDANKRVAEDPSLSDRLATLDNFYNRYGFFEDNGREHMLSSSFGHAFGSGYAGGGFAQFADIPNAVLDLYEAGNQEAAFELLRECLVGVMVNSFMESVRKIWTPVMHQGSQSECYEEYQLLNTITENVIKARKAEYDCED